MKEPEENAEHPTPNAESTMAEGPAAEDLSVQTLVVICGCSDGKTRAIAFDNEGKQARKVHGFIRHIQGSKLVLHKEPVVLVQLDETAPPPASAEEPEPAFGEHIREAIAALRPLWRRLFNRKSQIANRQC